MKSTKPDTCIQSQFSIGTFAQTLRIGLHRDADSRRSTGFFVRTNFTIQSIGFARELEFVIGKPHQTAANPTSAASAEPTDACRVDITQDATDSGHQP